MPRSSPRTHPCCATRTLAAPRRPAGDVLEAVTAIRRIDEVRTVRWAIVDLVGRGPAGTLDRPSSMSPDNQPRSPTSSNTTSAHTLRSGRRGNPSSRTSVHRPEDPSHSSPVAWFATSSERRPRDYPRLGPRAAPQPRAGSDANRRDGRGGPQDGRGVPHGEATSAVASERGHTCGELGSRVKQRREPRSRFPPSRLQS